MSCSGNKSCLLMIVFSKQDMTQENTCFGSYVSGIFVRQLKYEGMQSNVDLSKVLKGNLI